MAYHLPLICFHIIERHQSERVLGRFGMRQGIPESCDTEFTLHRYDLRGQQDDDWMAQHREYIQRWESRHDHIASGEAFLDPLTYHDPYMNSTLQQIYHLAHPNDHAIRQLCISLLVVVLEMDQLQGSSIIATT